MTSTNVIVWYLYVFRWYLYILTMFRRGKVYHVKSVETGIYGVKFSAFEATNLRMSLSKLSAVSRNGQPKSQCRTNTVLGILYPLPCMCSVHGRNLSDWLNVHRETTNIASANGDGRAQTSSNIRQILNARTEALRLNVIWCLLYAATRFYESFHEARKSDRN